MLNVRTIKMSGLPFWSSRSRSTTCSTRLAQVPGAVEEELLDAHRSALDWRALLRRHMTDAARRDYSWSVPNRRFIDGGLYLPSIRSEGIDTIAVIVDTSGSLPGETLALFWAEVREIAAELQPETVALLQVDAAVQDAALYASGDLPEGIAIKGRGGTDFRPGFAWLSEQGLRPSCCLYPTDMACDRYPETEPNYPVVWCNWGPLPGERIDMAGPWGRAPPPVGRRARRSGRAGRRPALVFLSST